MEDKLKYIQEDYNWEEVFKYAESPIIQDGPGGKVGGRAFTREDIAEVIAFDDGENDGWSWIGVFKLKDGMYAGVSAGCDYTGWG